MILGIKIDVKIADIVSSLKDQESYFCQNLHYCVLVVRGYHHPGIVSGVVTWEGLARLAVVVILLGKQVTHRVRGVAAPLDVHQQGSVRHHVLF